MSNAGDHLSIASLLGQFVLSTPNYETYQHTQKKHIDELGSFSLLSEKTILEFPIQQMILHCMHIQKKLRVAVTSTTIFFSIYAFDVMSKAQNQ
jgi:hypothetical protein